MCIHSVKPFKLIPFGLVLSALNIFILTSPPAILLVSCVCVLMLHVCCLWHGFAAVLCILEGACMPSFSLVLSVLNSFIPTNPRATYAQSCLHVYVHIGAIMPARICTHRRKHAHACMHTCTQSFTYVYAHICAIMPARICTHRHHHAHTDMPCPCLHAHISAIVHTRICTCKRDHAHLCMHTQAQSFSRYTHTKVLSCPQVYANIGMIMPMCICTHKLNHAHVYMQAKA
jgi:hypothetical protein